MSYILDALKKAESERARGAIPGLSTNQADSTLYIVRDGWHPAWWVAAVLLAVAALAVGFWPNATTPAPAPALVQSPALTVPLPAQTAVPVAVPVPIAAPALVPMATAAPALPPPAPVTATTTATAARPAPALVPAQPQPLAQPSPPTTVPVPVVPTLASTTVANRPVSGPQSVPALADLPESLRHQMPPINITGAVYSDSPPEWTLVVNDQVLGRGGLVAPELRLEEVSGSSAVFSFRGQRFRMDR